MCDLEREIGLRLSGRILGVHPFADPTNALAPGRWQISSLPRAGPRLAPRPARRSKRAGCFVTGDEKVLEESNEKAAGLVCNHGSG